MKPLKLLPLSGIFILLSFVFVFSSCEEKPDLKISSKDWDISGMNYRVNLTVKNVGNLGSGECLVYINYIDPSPPSGMNEIRIQESEQIPKLKPGEEYIFFKDIPLSDIYAKEIIKIQVPVDAKDMVNESIESNNTEEWIWDEGF